MRNQHPRLPLFLLSLVVLLAHLVGCGNQVVGWPIAGLDRAPMVTSTTPVNGETSVAPNAAVAATFSEPMDPSTITGKTFFLEQDSTHVPGSVMYVGVTALFVPTTVLEADTRYTATVTPGVTDRGGISMAEEYVWTFTTGTALDTTPPLVSATTPDDGVTEVKVNASLVVHFSEPMNATTIDSTTLTMVAGTATPVTAAVTYIGVTAIIDPDETLDADTVYTATVSDAVTDLAGNHMAQDYVWSFTTGAAPDTTPPRVSSTNPMNRATGVMYNASLNATFSEVMDPLSITSTTFTLLDGTTPVPCAVSYIGYTATFNPIDDLAVDTLYTAIISDDAMDLAGNTLASDYVWTFTTGPEPDTQRPHVTFTVPSDDATGAAIGGAVAAVFSEAMNPLTMTASNFTVQQMSTPVAGTVSYHGLTATFNPISPLAADTTYSATVTTAALDLAGNSLERNYVWNFTTGSTPDTTRPWVVSTIPSDEALGTLLDTSVSVTFNEMMDPLTLTTATFTLEDETGLVDSAVISIGTTSVLVPTDSLEPDTEYTAIIAADAADLSGNELEEEYAWTFTTGTDTDSDSPTVIATNPDDEEIDVPIDAAVNATFSEAMNPLTVTASSFEVTGPETTEVTGTVVYNALTMIATFTPDLELLEDTTYTATITTEAMDLAGQALEDDYVWMFTTGSTALGMEPVDLGTLSTFVAVAGAGLTNSNSSGTTTLNGDVGLYPTATCLGDGSPCTETNPVINGTLYADDAEGVAAQAKVDLTAAYVDAMSRPAGTTVSDLSGMVLPPGVYTSGSTMSIAVGEHVILDGEGDANAVWIFQIGSSLTVNNDAEVLLIDGADAANVFWAAFASTTLGSNVSFQGSVLAGASNSVGTDSVVVGRLLCTTGQITLLSNTITLP